MHYTMLFLSILCGHKRTVLHLVMRKKINWIGCLCWVPAVSQNNDSDFIFGTRLEDKTISLNGNETDTEPIQAGGINLPFPIDATTERIDLVWFAGAFFYSLL